MKDSVLRSALLIACLLAAPRLVAAVPLTCETVGPIAVAGQQVLAQETVCTPV